MSPDRSQFFRYEPLSLSCGGSRNASGWTVVSRTLRGVSACGRAWGSVRAGACVVSEAYTWHSGAYWCQAPSGDSGPAANVTVSGQRRVDAGGSEPLTPRVKRCLVL